MVPRPWGCPRKNQLNRPMKGSKNPDSGHRAPDNPPVTAGAALSEGRPNVRGGTPSAVGRMRRVGGRRGLRAEGPNPRTLSTAGCGALPMAQRPEPASPSHRNGVPQVSHTRRSQRVKCHPRQHSLYPNVKFWSDIQSNNEILSLSNFQRSEAISWPGSGTPYGSTLAPSSRSTTAPASPSRPASAASTQAVTPQMADLTGAVTKVVTI